MAKNAAIQELLLRKGDKIALGVGGGLAAIFLVLGLVAVVGADSPSSTVKQFEDQAKRVRNGVNAPGGDAPPLPDWVGKVQDFKKIPPAEFAFSGRPFEPTTQPDMLAENPKVMPITTAQTNVLRVPMLALDVRDSADGSTRMIGVLAQKATTTKNNQELQKSQVEALRKLLDPKYKPAEKKSNRVSPTPQPQPGAGGGFPGGMGGPGGGVMPGGRGGMGGPGGMMGGPGGMMGGGGGMMPGGMGGMMGAERDDRTVVYKSPAEVAKSGDQMAMSVYPLRAVMVNATFPLRDQMEEIQRALRIKPIRDRSGKNTLENVPNPEFDGFDVERRVAAPGEDITKAQWAEFDHLTEYHNKIAMRRWEYINEAGGDLSRFLRPEEKLVAPLPLLADGLGGYPMLTQLKPLVDEIERMKQAGIQPIPPSEWDNRFKKSAGENPYAPSAGFSGGQPGGAGGGMMPGMGAGGYGNQAGYGGGYGGARGNPGGAGGPMGGMMPRPGGPGGMTPGRGGPGGDEMPGGPGGLMGGGTMSGSGRTGTDVDNLLVRFFDPDIRPGYSYQYKIRIRMKNPNYGQKDKVGRPADATVEVLTGPPQETVPVTVPTESYLYAYQPAQYVEEAKQLVDDNGKEFTLRRLLEQEEVESGKRAVVQIQRWAEQLNLGSGKAEPIGTWVVAEIPVAPGEYIGRRQLIELPLWSAGAESYVLRELSGGVKVKGLKDDRHQPKGWPVNFRDPVNPSILVDFDGGRVNAKVGEKPIKDDSAAELLILQADGKLVVHNSAVDMADPERTERTQTWDDWLKRVKARKSLPNAPGGGGPGGPGGFGRPGGSGGGGPGGSGSGDT
ncbi:MAG: hypothetical protein U0871_25685 [Gemmataceae bacterium]